MRYMLHLSEGHNDTSATKKAIKYRVHVHVM